MFIQVQKVPPEGQDIERDLPAEALSPQEDVRLVGQVVISGRLNPIEEGGVCLLGRLDATVEVACVRCLEPFRTEMHEELDLLFLPRSANVGPGPGKDEERELSDKDLAVSYYDEDRIDLSQLVWEQVYLALPMKPLCDEKCRGLCPQCGTNLNRTPCGCQRQVVDPRLAGLKTLLES